MNPTPAERAKKFREHIMKHFYDSPGNDHTPIETCIAAEIEAAEKAAYERGLKDGKQSAAVDCYEHEKAAVEAERKANAEIADIHRESVDLGTTTWDAGYRAAGRNIGNSIRARSRPKGRSKTASRRGPSR